MKPLIVLLSAFLATVLCFVVAGKPADYSWAGRVGMAAMLAFTAIGHFVYKKGMVKMMPGFMPFKEALVLVSGLWEIAAALLLLFPGTARVTGYLLIAFFIGTLPININAARQGINYQQPDRSGPGLRYLWFRVPLQMLFIAWVMLLVLG